MSDSALRVEMCEMGALLWERRLIGGTEGNISCRLPNGNILCTPSGVMKGFLRPENLIEINSEGEVQDRSSRMGFRDANVTEVHPSSEIKMHLAIYRDRTDAFAIVHAHPPYATARAYAEQPLKPGMSPEGDAVLGHVGWVPFITPGTQELAEGVAIAALRTDVVLLGRHGATAIGRSIFEATIKMETLERVSEVLHLAEQLR
ncbi:MAG TPA: class II aldolase/adducin family protein [Fimbriimonas sp.]|nr:class II aldolase/adducin family protein [Fimbriimonas sp.]